MFYHLQLLINYTQVIRQEHPSHLNLIINILLPKNKNNTLNTDDIHSYVTPQTHNYSVQATYTPPSLTQLNTTLPISPVELHTTEQLPPAGK